MMDLPFALPVLRTKIDTLDGVISVVSCLIRWVRMSWCWNSIPLLCRMAESGCSTLLVTLSSCLPRMGPGRQLPVFEWTVCIVLDIAVHLATTTHGTATPLLCAYLKRETLLFLGSCMLERTKLKVASWSRCCVVGLLTVAAILHLVRSS